MSQRRLLELLQVIRYGRIHRLDVRRGQPCLDDRVTWTRVVKVLGSNEPHPRCPRDAQLPDGITEFLTRLAELGDGTIANIEVRNGLPFSYEIEERLGG